MNKVYQQKIDFKETEKISNLTEVKNMLTAIADQIKMEEKLEIAKKMKEEGDSIEKIARITGLPVEEIVKL